MKVRLKEQPVFYLSSKSTGYDNNKDSTKNENKDLYKSKCLQ